MNAPSGITLASSALGWFASVLTALGSVALGVSYLRSVELATTLSAYERRLERDLRFLQLPLSARALARGHACSIAALLAVSAALGTWLALALPLAALITPKLYSRPRLPRAHRPHRKPARHLVGRAVERAPRHAVARRCDRRQRGARRTTALR